MVKKIQVFIGRSLLLTLILCQTSPILSMEESQSSEALAMRESEVKQSGASESSDKLLPDNKDSENNGLSFVYLFDAALHYQKVRAEMEALSEAIKEADIDTIGGWLDKDKDEQGSGLWPRFDVLLDNSNLEKSKYPNFIHEFLQERIKDMMGIHININFVRLQRAMSQEKPIEALQALVNNNVNLDEKDVQTEKTILQRACMLVRDLEVVKFLVAKGASMETRDWSGDTPLHTAIRYNRPEVAVALINAGAPLDIQNGYGQTPLALAKLSENDLNNYNHKVWRDAAYAMIPVIDLLKSKNAPDSKRNNMEYVSIGNGKYQWQDSSVKNRTIQATSSTTKKNRNDSLRKKVLKTNAFKELPEEVVSVQESNSLMQGRFKNVKIAGPSESFDSIMKELDEITTV